MLSADCWNCTMNLRGVKLTWLGHATFRIETPAGKTVIIDPWVMNNPMCPDSEKNPKKVDILLCTHGHGDHIGDAVEICKKVQFFGRRYTRIGALAREKGRQATRRNE
jgi:L-ascorbate metabolism protein UlaG (beta-lactamase superfamily)